MNNKCFLLAFFDVLKLCVWFLRRRGIYLKVTLQTHAPTKIRPSWWGAEQPCQAGADMWSENPHQHEQTFYIYNNWVYFHNFSRLPYPVGKSSTIDDCITPQSFLNPSFCGFLLYLNFNQWIRVLEHSRTFYRNS